MTLRRKTLIVVGLTLFALIALLYASSQLILLDSYLALEEQHLQQDIQRTLNVLADELVDLSRTVADWAHWDDTYAFILDGNADYIESNLVDGTFVTVRANLMLFVNTRGEIVYGKAFDLETAQEVPLPTDLAAHLSAGSPLLSHAEADRAVSGLLILSGGPMLVASQPILSSAEEGPPHGTLIWGRALDDAGLAYLADLAYLSLTARAYDAPQMPPDFQAAREAFERQLGPMVIQTLDAYTIAGYVLLEDVYGNPALLLRVDGPRDIYQQGQRAASYFILALLAAGLAFGGVALLLLERLVLARLAGLSAGVSRITASGDRAARVAVRGADELAQLGSTINAMLDALLRLNTELEGRVVERTAELERGRMQLQAILDSMGDGVIYSEDSATRYVNRALAAMTGYEFEELLDEPFSLLMADAEDTRDLRPVLDDSLGRAVWREETRLRRKDGSEFDAALTMTLLDGMRATPVREVTLIRDISQEKALQAQRGRFIANAAHELRTPVSNAIMRLYLLRRQPENLEQHLDILDRVIQRMKHLVEDLLDLSRFERGVIQLSRETVILQDLAAEVVTLQQAQAEAKGIRLTSVWPEQPLRADADPDRIMQVITNLVVNAIHYTPEGGQVAVRLTAEDSHARIDVQDTGIGIAPEEIPHLFEPFYRVRQSEGDGSGLGLNIAQEIVTLHGGAITVESEEGIGSTFTIRLALVT